ncbi:MAG: pitrilysin family protein [Pseudomonadota bacterium]
MQQLAQDGAATPPGPAVSTFTLPNGMDAVVIEDHRAPVVTHMVWYRVGAADEARGESGVAHYLEHLMFKGTDTIPSGRFSKIIAENGGQDNAFTSYDYTGYFQRIANDRLSMVMEMEADRMANLRLTEEDANTERDVVLEERSSRTDNDPQSLFFEQMAATLYYNHPYGVPVIGWRSEIEALTRKDALAFYERHYAPDNAILVVAGAVTPEEVAALAERHYGPLTPSGAPAYERAKEPPHLAERRVAMTDARVRQPFVARTYITPSYRTGAAGEAEALTVLGDILGGGASGRLYRQLVTEQKIALDAGGYYSGTARDDGSFSVYAAPRDDTSLADVEAALDAVIAEIAETGPTEDELRRSIMVLTSSRIYQQDSQSSMARLYGRALTLGLTVEDVRQWPARISQVTAEQVRDAALSLRREASVTGTLAGEPEAAAEPGAAPDERAEAGE